MLATGSGGAGVWREVGIVPQPIVYSYQPPLGCISSLQVLVTTTSLLGLYHLLADSPWPPIVHTVSFLSQLEGSLYLLALSDTFECSPVTGLQKTPRSFLWVSLELLLLHPLAPCKTQGSPKYDTHQGKRYIFSALRSSKIIWGFLPSFPPEVLTPGVKHEVVPLTNLTHTDILTSLP